MFSNFNWTWKYRPVAPATQEAEAGRWKKSKVCLAGRVSFRPAWATEGETLFLKKKEERTRVLEL